MTTEIKQCQNCKKEFVIDSEDFQFYEKIQVPPPTFCPWCRFRRRLAFLNYTTLYKRACDLCRKEFVSMYAPEAPYRVYCPRCWWSDGWDHFAYGRDYDFSRPFFEQFNDLLHETPLIGISIDPAAAENSPYNNHASDLKNCYLLFHAGPVEESAYGFFVTDSRRVFDCSLSLFAELCYDSMHLYKTNRCVGCRGDVTESLDCAFLRDSSNCQNCFASANLRNKKYYIFNKPYTKEDYFKELSKWDLGSYAAYQEIKRRAEEHWKRLPPRPEYADFSTDWTGSYVFQSRNCKECYSVAGARDSKYLFMMSSPPIEECYDVSAWGMNAHLLYEGCSVGTDSSNLRFCWESGLNLYGAEYCKLSMGGSNHFGCVAVRKGDYCILNKRYSKEEFEELRAKIIEHMHAMPYADSRARAYRYGEFFPIEMSTFAYNDTIANKFFPMTRTEVAREGCGWREPDAREYAVTKGVANLPDHVKDAPGAIVDEIIGCARCGRGFRIIPMELAFLRQMNLPLPRECPFCRIGTKFDLWVKNLQLFDRACSRCGAAFRAPYAPEDAPDILCKTCYLEETQ